MYKYNTLSNEKMFIINIYCKEKVFKYNTLSKEYIKNMVNSPILS